MSRCKRKRKAGKSKKNINKSDRHYTDKHHRKPSSRGGSNDSANISIVPKRKHVAYHTVFGNKLANEIADELNWRWIDPDFKLIAVPKRLARRIRRELCKLMEVQHAKK